MTALSGCYPGVNISENGTPGGGGTTTINLAGENISLIFTGTAGNLVKWLGPYSLGNSTNTDAQIASAVTKSHTQGTDTYQGIQISPLNMGNQKITSLGAPSDNTDAATKKFVLDQVLTGPAGATGATGATGPAGPNNITTSTTTNLTGFLYGASGNVTTQVENITGKGSVNALPKWTSVSQLGNSNVSDNGTYMVVAENISTTGNIVLSGAGMTVDGVDVSGLPVCGIEFVIDGGGSAITTGMKGFLEIPFTCTINQWTLLNDVTGGIQVSVWKDVYANYPPTSADNITAWGNPMQVVNATCNQTATMTGWTTTTITAGDIIGFNVDSDNLTTRCTVGLKVTKQ